MVETTFEQTDVHVVEQNERDLTDKLYDGLGASDVPTGYSFPVAVYSETVKRGKWLKPNSIFSNTLQKSTLIEDVYGYDFLEGRGRLRDATDAQVGRIFQNQYRTAERVMNKLK